MYPSSCKSDCNFSIVHNVPFVSSPLDYTTVAMSGKVGIP